MDNHKIKKVVKTAYGKIAEGQKGCGCGSSCAPGADKFAQSIGYSKAELQSIPKESNLGLSCGNPTALAGIKAGEVVLDLGSGAGFDCFLAANKVGKNGKVIGIDMTPQMVAKAKENARQSAVKNVDFRLGEIEHLPVEDNSVDLVISNCVINLSSDKSRVFREIHRVLKPGGRISISDIALKKPLPDKVRQNIEAYVGCVAGAMVIGEYQKILAGSGLRDAKITIKGSSDCIDTDTKDPLAKATLDSLGSDESLEEYVVSVYVEGRK
jgi:arsenite methyltransferase